MHFFLTLDKNGSVGFSPFREGNDQNSSVVSYLSVPLSCATIQAVQGQLCRRGPFDFWFKGSKRKDTKLEILKILKVFGWNESDLTWKECSPAPVIDQGPPEEQNNEVEKAFNQLTRGRQLSTGDLRGLARELKIKEDDIKRLAQANVEKGRAKWVPAVSPIGKGWRCQRCGERDVEEWPSQYEMAATCRSCESIGASTSLDALYRDEHSLLGGPSEVIFRPHWVLTDAQHLASEQVFEFIKDPCEETALLWAACGAGKTEVCFPSAAWALKQGKSILFAAPRQDVINDIAPRLHRDFPDYPFQVLSGTSSAKFQGGGMVLATTHQVLRFWRAFDVIFMDEMDAFPYSGSRALEWGLNHALRQGGKILYLTATPSSEGLKAVRQGKMRLIRLPARHHRTSLPVPIWVKSRITIDPNGCTSEWASQSILLRAQGPVLVFVPKIAWIDPWIKCFRQCFPGWQVDGSYSADPGRSSKIERLRQGEFDIFVSTTILERGITLSRIQVVVLGADHPVFDERALVQMAGRVGRTIESPVGSVLFMSKRMTKAMKTAVQWIEEQNKCALELGLIEA
ncbi:MAG: restriction endonuclease subunit R [Desulfosporosinus sp. BRH_c37]|nr:MAG: restriction endonuclease subunit R [Desulfosporosinus sp. BRH_c37]